VPYAAFRRHDAFVALNAFCTRDAPRSGAAY
jgi:hypothetical protein